MAASSDDAYFDRRLTTIFMVALYHWNIRLECLASDCTHSRVLQGHQLWWLFHRRQWGDDLAGIPKRFYCGECWHHRFRKVGPPKWSRTRDQPTGPELPWPDDGEWKRMVSRYRT